MKAISVKQPFAHLIASGRKSVEARTSSTNYRGLLLICTTAKPTNLNLDGELLVGGHAICVVDLLKVEPMKKFHRKGACWEESDNFDDDPSPQNQLFAWTFVNPRVVKLFPVKGRLKLNAVDDKLIKFSAALTCIHARPEYKLPDAVEQGEMRIMSPMKQVTASMRNLYMQHPGIEELHKKNMRKMRRVRLKADDFSGYLQTFESHKIFQPFVKIIPRLSALQYWKLLVDVWSGVEVIHPNERTWLSLLESSKPHRESLMTPEEHEALTKLPDEIEILRGSGDKIGACGLSWTLHREKAEWFASYACGARRGLFFPQLCGRTPILVRAVCKKSDVIAHFLRREEFEIVVNPKKVKVLESITVKFDPLA